MANQQGPSGTSIIITIIGLALTVTFLVLAIGWGCASATHRKLPAFSSSILMAPRSGMPS